MDFDAIFERAHGGDFCAAECFAGVGAVDDAAQVVFGDVGGEQADDFKGEFGVAEGAPPSGASPISRAWLNVLAGVLPRVLM